MNPNMYQYMPRYIPYPPPPGVQWTMAAPPVQDVHWFQQVPHYRMMQQYHPQFVMAPVPMPLPPPPPRPFSNGNERTLLDANAAPYVRAEMAQMFDRPSPIRLSLEGSSQPQHYSGEAVIDHEKLRQPMLPDKVGIMEDWTTRMLWSTLLYVEEAQRAKVYDSFDMTTQFRLLTPDVINLLAKERGFLISDLPWSFMEMDVPGVLEKRPYLMFNDSVRIRALSDPRVEYIGRVLTVSGSRITLVVPQASSLQDVSVRLRFQADRTHFTLMQSFLKTCALPKYDELPMAMEEVLVGQNSDGDNADSSSFFQTNLNEEQRLAVDRIVNGKSTGHLPFIVFGPAGTGKTMVVVEAILQLMMKTLQAASSNVRILICAPSDAACDVVVNRIAELMKIARPKMIRVNSHKRRPEEVQHANRVLPHCLLATAQHMNFLFRFPTADEIAGAKVIVATCAVAALLMATDGRIKKGDFSHIIVDESAQAMEPETLILMSLLERDKTQLVLAGDPFQLGASVMSAEARGRGLDVSLQERLMNDTTLPYFKQDDRFIATLTKNYRSHKALLEVPNRLFYNSSLTSEADELMVNSMREWKWLPQRDFPLVFYSHKGTNKHERDQPTFHNDVEIKLVVSTILSMIRSTDVKPSVKSTDVGVVCLFRGQVAPMRVALRKEGLGEVSVGTVDDMQGQEFRVVMVSTVLSDPKWLAIKHSHPILGFIPEFVGNPKRFNVAMTRAKALCIVFGNPDFLILLKSTWRMVMEVCKQYDSIKGVIYELDEEQKADDEELEQNLSWTEKQLAKAFDEVYIE